MLINKGFVNDFKKKFSNRILYLFCHAKESFSRCNSTAEKGRGIDIDAPRGDGNYSLQIKLSTLSYWVLI